jgi:hypothetical protein
LTSWFVCFLLRTTGERQRAQLEFLNMKANCELHDSTNLTSSLYLTSNNTKSK